MCDFKKILGEDEAVINRILQNPQTKEALIRKLIKEAGLCQMKGDVDILVRNEKTGEIVGKRIIRNLVINVGLYHIADRLQDTPVEAEMGWAAIGSNNTTPIAGDTTLGTELGRVALTSKIRGTGGNANQVTYSATIPAGTGTGTVIEAGLFNASSDGLMLARSIFAPIVKGSGDAVDISWVLTVSAA